MFSDCMHDKSSNYPVCWCNQEFTFATKSHMVDLLRLSALHLPLFLRTMDRMFEYQLPLWRPPSEADSLILQATVGCSWNRCSFCSMYRGKTFTARPLADVLSDVDHLAREWPEARRVFLADGDALVLSTEHLLRILGHLQRRLPRLARASCYALPHNLLRKTPGELLRLREAGLRLLYYGIETGDPALLKRVVKGATPRGMAEGLAKAADAGIKVSATVVLGLAGRHGWREHIDGTVALLDRVPLNYLSTLQLGLEPSVQAGFLRRFEGTFQPQDDTGILQELERLITRTHPPRPLIFRSNHASNALPLAGNLPRDRKRLLREITAVGCGERGLRPLWRRGF